LLERTFVHIQGIGSRTEKRLWDQGIKTWHHFLASEAPLFSPTRDALVREELHTSIRHRGNIHYFGKRLASGEMWRLFGAFRQGAVYLDIETSGGYEGVDEITVIGLYDGHRTQSFVSGVNLDQFEAAISHYDLVITFNGTTFDLPYIRREFPNIFLPPVHIDLRFLLKRLGYRGGLKRIEKALNIDRAPEIDGLSGYHAVMLWKAFQWGDESALERLIRYNRADIVNLQPLMEMGYKAMKESLLA